MRPDYSYTCAASECRQPVKGSNLYCVWCHFPKKGVIAKARKEGDRISLLRLHSEKRRDQKQKKLRTKYNQAVCFIMSPKELARNGHRKEWHITFSEYAELLKDGKCFYCKEKLSPAGSSLDRINNSRGYYPDNVVPCCGRCNKMRGDHVSHTEFKAMMTTLIRLRTRT